MNRYFMVAKAAVSLVILYYLPAFMPFVVVYWLGVGFIYWRGKRGLPRPGTPQVAVEYLGGYPGLTPPQQIWLHAEADALLSGGLRLPYEAMRKVRVLDRREGVQAAQAAGLMVPPTTEADLFLAVLWRSGPGEEREAVFRLPGGQGGRDLRRVKERVEALRRARGRSAAP